MKRVAVFVPCHNRKLVTLAFFRHLTRIMPENILVDYWLLDDGSTDGTTQAILTEFDFVKNISLDGSCFWGGSLNVIRGVVSSVYSDRDLILVCNDDIRLSRKSMESGLKIVECVDVLCPVSQSFEFDPADSLAVSGSGGVWNYGCEFDSVRFEFRPLEVPRATNLGETFAMLSKTWPWKAIDPIPRAIPHYLSDYWLTYSFSVAGAKIITDASYFCCTSSKTTRNKKNSFYLDIDVDHPPVSLRGACSTMLAFFAAGGRYIMSSLRDSIDPVHPNYRRAFIKFRSRYSKERFKSLKVLLMMLSDQAIRFLFFVLDVGINMCKKSPNQ